MLAPAPAGAAPRAFAPRFATNDTGDITMAANTLMTCPDTDPLCPSARAGTLTGAADNNNYVMRYVNTDPVAPGGVFDSSGADLTLPAGALVLKAFLYFGADSSAGTGGIAPPNAAARNTVMFKPPRGTYQTLTAPTLDVITTDGQDYQGVVDVTNLVSDAGSGRYWVANVQAGTGRDRQAGWSLVVAYRNTSQPPRNLSIFDGFQVVNSGNPNVTIPVTGFQTPSSGAVRTRLGFVAYEGDAGSTGDSVRLDTTTISDPANPPQNFFNSAISTDGVAVTTKNPNYVNQLGFDSILSRADGVLANGATSAAIHLTTGGETYFPGAVTFATDLYSPDVSLVKSVDDLNGGQLTPGDVLRYTVTARNVGQDDAVGVVLHDPIPANATYVPGPLTVDGVPKNDDYPGTDTAGFDATTNQAVFWVGTGAAADAGGTLARSGGTATVTFDVRVGAVPSGTTIRNAAHADFFAATVGVPLGADSNSTSSTVAAPDLTVSKTPSVFSVVVPGGTQTFQLTATNVGDAPTSGTVTVTDPVGVTGFDQIVSAGGTGWTCTPATLPALAPVTLVHPQRSAGSRRLLPADQRDPAHGDLA